MRVAVVTGGTRGIGSAICKTLQKNGYMVVANYKVNEKAAKEFADKTGVAIKKWDVSNYGECEKSLKEIEKEFGPVDILINNAGITRDTFLHKMTPGQWQEVISTNLDSCFNVTRAVIGAMRERTYGRIVNISSINGQKGQLGQSNYAAAKAGILGFTRALALENAAKGVTVNAIAPGYIETDMVKNIPESTLQEIIKLVPVGRLGMADEIARTVLFLVDDKSGYITGATINVNGGQYFT